MNMAQVMRDRSDPHEEPARDQTAILDDEVTVVMMAVLDRTAVVKVGDDRVLVSLRRLDVDPQQLRWQRRAELTPRAAFLRQRQSRSESAG